MRKIVLDTKVFVSGFLWNGNEAILIKKIEQKLAQCFITEEILAEIENVVRRDKFSEAFLLAHSSPDEMIAKIRNLSTIIKPPKLQETIVKEDPADDKFIACAMEARAGHIVSRDSYLLKIGEFAGIKIISAGRALKIL